MNLPAQIAEEVNNFGPNSPDDPVTSAVFISFRFD
jgi:hypothetical protein